MDLRQEKRKGAAGFMEKKATIRDVARHAGVSVASVSYALNGVDKITPETKARIMKSIEELDYRPNMTARCLSNGDSRLIGVTLPITEAGDVPGVLLDNPFFGEFISGIEYTIRNKGYDILLSGVETNEQYKNWIQQRKLDGIIMLGVYPKSIFEEITNIGVPVVLTDSYEEYTKDFHKVLIEDELGAYMAVKYLISQGHKEIAIATGNIRNSHINMLRYQGYQRALTEAGLPVREELFYESHVSLDGGYQIGKKVLSSERKATAIFAVADVMAIGFMKSFQEGGNKIPEDFSVVGFDGIKFGQYMTPILTTIKQDSIRKGMAAAELLLADLSKGTRGNETVVLKPELFIGGSVRSLTARK